MIIEFDHSSEKHMMNMTIKFCWLVIIELNHSSDHVTEHDRYDNYHSAG